MKEDDPIHAKRFLGLMRGMRKETGVSLGETFTGVGEGKRVGTYSRRSIQDERVISRTESDLSGYIIIFKTNTKMTF